MEAVVVLSTYNGENVIRRQLDSLRKQTWPIRVLIRDDCSTDNTTQIIKDYIQIHHLERWQMTRNEHNFGWKQNFMEGIKSCGGDVIFPCDQDDVWYPEKVETMLRVIERHDEVLLLSCDINIIYEQGAIRAKVYHQKKDEKEKPIARYLFTDQFFKNPRPGCSYAIRRSFFDSVQRYWKDTFPHDEFLWLMAAMQNGAYFYNSILMDYIRSAAVASDIRFKDVEMQKENLQYIRDALNAMETFAADNPGKVSAQYADKIRGALGWCERRQRLMDTRNPFRWLVMMPDWKYYNSAKNCLSDLYLVLFGSFKRKAI